MTRVMTLVVSVGRIMRSQYVKEPLPESSRHTPSAVPDGTRSVPATFGNLHHLQPTHGSPAGGKLVRLDSQALEHGDEEVGERVIVLLVEGEVLAVPEAAAGQEHGQVDVGVRVGAAHARPV